MAIIDYDKVQSLYGTSPELQAEFVDYLRTRDTTLDFSKFDGLDDKEIFTTLMQERPDFTLSNNNPNKPLLPPPPREQTYARLSTLDEALKNQSVLGKLSLGATQILDQLNPTPIRSKELENRRETAREILNDLQKAGVTSEQFNREYGDSPYLREAYFENQDIFSNIYDMSHDVSAKILGRKSAQAKAYDKELESFNLYKQIAQKRIDEPASYHKALSQEQREIIKDSVGAVSAWLRNDSDKELVDLFFDLQNAKESATNFVQAQKRLENVNTNEQFLGLIGALRNGKDFDKKQKAMIDDYAIIAKELGFDTLAYNKQGLYFIKDEKAYKVEQSFTKELKEVFKNNIGSLAGAIAGAEYGYKRGGFKPMVVYGALGATTGGAFDSIVADVLANKKIDLAQALIHGAQEGALNITADMVLKVAGTAIKTLNPHKLKDVAGTIIDYTPIVGFISRAHDGNKAAAQKLLNATMSKENQADLKALEALFGAEVQIGQANKSKAAKALESLKQRLGQDSLLAKGAQKFYDTFAFTDQKSAQKDFIRAIRADESGHLSAFLSEAANSSPTLQKNLQSVLHTTTQKLLNQLERFDLEPQTIKNVFDNFERGTKDSYKQAVQDILGGIYDDSYKVILSRENPNYPEHLELGQSRYNTQSYESFKAKMQASGVMLEDSAKFLKFVESSIYNPQGASFESLNNALKTINAYHKQATDPNFRSFVKDALNGFLKRDIQAGIESIFKQNPALYSDARVLFDTALNDYAKMKDTLKLVDKLKVRDRGQSYAQVANSLSSFFLAQGDKIPNFEALFHALDKGAREQIELKLLQDMLNISLVKIDSVKVLDSTEFFTRLEPLKGYFTSKSAQDFIKIAQDFHTLFRNDARLLQSMRPAVTEKIGSSIATTLEGAVKFQIIKALFANIVRLLPHIPFAKGLNEKVQGSAIRYHLKKALDSSLSVGEFRLELQARALKADFNNATKEQIAKILGQVESASDELEAITTPPSTPSQANLESSTPSQAQESPAVIASHSEAIQKQAPESKELESTQSLLAQAQKAKQETKLAQEQALQEKREHARQVAKERAEYNDKIQALKDSRAGKGELERDIQIGEPIPTKPTELIPTSVSTDDDHIYILDYVIVKAQDTKPNFESDGLQPRTKREHSTIESISQHFKPDMILGRGGYKDLPIIARDGQVITGNHRIEGFKNFSQESRQAYEQAIRAHYNIDLAPDELLLRTPRENLSTQELLSIAYNSNKEDIKNLGDHIYQVLGRYAPYFENLPRQLETTSVQDLKQKIAQALDPSPYPNIADTNLALLVYTMKADKNANITEVLNAFAKLPKDDADKTLDTFIDTAGLWHILSNNAVEYGLKNLDLRPYLLPAFYKCAQSLHQTRAQNFKELNEQIRHIIDTTDSSGSNMMLEMMPNTYNNLIGDILGASIARFIRLENPSAQLYDALKGTNDGLLAQLQPRFDFVNGTITQGKSVSEADIFDFLEYMITRGEGGEQVADTIDLLPALRQKYESFTKAHPDSKPTAPEPKELEPKPLESTQEQGLKEANSSTTFTDTKGREYTLTKEVQEQWLNTFNLKSLDEAYTPKHSDEIKQALDNKEIRLQLGSLKKLVAQGREKYIPQIKEVLENPEAILKDSDNAFLFMKHLKDDDYFVNVSVDKGEYLVSISNGIKETNNIKNKLDFGAKVVYQSPNANSNLQTLLQTSRYSANKIDSDIIPQANTPKQTPPSLFDEPAQTPKEPESPAVIASHSEAIQKQAPESTALESKGEKIFNQADIKLEKFSDFAHYAKLVGFGDLSAEQLRSAHKHILDNLDKVEC